MTSLGSKEEFYDALRQNRERPAGRARAVIAEEILDAAEAFGDRSIVVSAAVELMSAYHGSGESVKYPVAFARLLQLWDEAPEDFDEYETHRLFWYFKWVTGGLLDTPDVPLSSIKGWIEEMRRRYVAADKDLQPVYAQKYGLAAHIGEGVDLAYELWSTRGRSRLSDCAACEARSRARYRIERGEDELALAELRPTFEGKSTCDEEPRTSQAAALVPLLRLGRFDEARTMHLTGYRAVRGNDRDMHAVGSHLEFCALTGNEARGLELLAQNRAVFAFTGDLLSRFHFLIGVEKLLARLVATGHGDVACGGPAGRDWTVASLRTVVTAEAEELAARFDARNGTGAASAFRHRRLDETVPLAEPMNLGVRTAALKDADTVGPLGSAPAAATAAVPAPTPIPDDFAELLAAARRLDKQAHPDAKALWSAVRVRALGPDAAAVDDLIRGELAVEAGYRASRRNDWDAATSAFREAAEWYAKADRRARVLSSEAREIWAEVMADRAADPARAMAAALPRLEELLAQSTELLATGYGTAELDADARSHLLVVRNSCLLAARPAALRSEPDTGSDQYGELFLRQSAAVIEEATAAGELVRVAMAHEVRSEYRVHSGDLAAAEEDARTAIRIFTDNGWPWRLHRARLLLGLTLAAQERFADAVAVLQTALVELHPGTEADEITPIHRMLADMAREAGDLATAVRAYSEAAVCLDRAGDVVAATETRWRMSAVLISQGSVADGVAVLETLVDAVLEAPAAGSDSAADPGAGGGDASSATPLFPVQLMAQIRMDLAQGLMSLGEPRDAAVEYLRVADTVSTWPDQSRLTYAAACAARALAQAGDWDAARVVLGRALTSHESAPVIGELSGVLRDLAGAAMNARGAEALDEALGYLDQADRLRTESPEVAARQFISVDVDEAQCALLRGKVLHAADQGERALAAFEAAIAAFDRSGSPAAGPGRFEAIRMAAVVELNALDRAPSAHARLDAAIPEAEQAGLADAAAALRRVRAMTG